MSTMSFVAFVMSIRYLKIVEKKTEHECKTREFAKRQSVVTTMLMHFVPENQTVPATMYLKIVNPVENFQSILVAFGHSINLKSWWCSFKPTFVQNSVQKWVVEEPHIPSGAYFLY